MPSCVALAHMPAVRLHSLAELMTESEKEELSREVGSLPHSLFLKKKNFSS